MKLKLNDFLIIKANWDDKYKNILEIHKKLNLSPENSLFMMTQILKLKVLIQ